MFNWLKQKWAGISVSHLKDSEVHIHIQEKDTEKPPVYIPPTDKTLHTHLHHLPTPTTAELIGRSAVLGKLQQAFDDQRVGVAVLVAGGGAGKSALTYHWLQTLKPHYGGVARVFAWSFYSQGHRKTYNDSSAFLREVLPFLGVDSVPQDEIEKGRRLADCLAQQAVLLILDGLEPLQLDQHANDGRLQDIALQHFFVALRQQRHPQSFVLLSSRQPVVELNDWTEQSEIAAPSALHPLYFDCPLNNLPPDDGAALLGLKGVQGAAKDVQAVSRDLGGHALSLAVLGSLVARRYDGVLPAEWRTLGGLNAYSAAAGDVDQTGRQLSEEERHAQRVLAWCAAAQLDEPARRFMHLLGLFDRPLGWKEKHALLQQVDYFQPLRDLGRKASHKLEQGLEHLSLLSVAEDGERTQWDSHAIIRSFFGRDFQQQQPSAFQAAHRALFDYYQAQAPEQPEDLDSMQPLYRAVLHGCLAGEYQKALDDVYYQRIERGGEGFGTKKLGAYAQNLSAIAAFFPAGWRQLEHTGLSDDDQAWLLSEAAFCLMSLGRLREALAPCEANLELRIKLEDWKNASIAAQNLTDLHLPLGDLSAAEQRARQALAWAEQVEDKTEQMKSQARLASVLHRQGHMTQARTAFERAEVLCAEAYPQYPRLFSLPGAWYCAFLLDALSCPQGLCGDADGNEDSVPVSSSDHDGHAALCPSYDKASGNTLVREVLERGEYGLKIKTTALLLDAAVNTLTLARAQALLPEASPSDTRTAFDRAVNAIEAAKSIDDAPPFYLARAAFLLAHDSHAAKRDIDYARSLIERCDMALYAVDANLLEAQYWRLQADAEQAAQCQERAEMGIAQTGYGLRKQVWPS